MEKEKLLAWTESVDRLLNDFKPSDNHSSDPIVRMLEKLQFLQDGHVCLAEVAVDARALLEKWDQDGIFDASGSSDDEGAAKDVEEEDGDDSGVRLDSSSRSGARQRDKAPLQHSYAYDTVRHRAAANMIKRSVLRWARAQESFRDRVDEIQLFGKTTSSLMQELTSTASVRRPTVSTPSDIFALVKVKQSGAYAHSIEFSDLMQFSRHVGLFSVDQAIRTVEELEMKRYLFMARCALKMQTLWRKARKVFQARRMRRLVEELREQREQERKQEKERLLLAAANTDALDISEGRQKSALSSSKKSRAVSESSSRMKPSSTGGGADSPLEKTRTRQNKVEARSRFDDDDGNTTDVETAWQAFLDSAQTADPGAEMDDWKNWSEDDEIGFQHYREYDADRDAELEVARKLRFRAKKTRVGTVSRMVPFAEFGSSKTDPLVKPDAVVRAGGSDALLDQDTPIRKGSTFVGIS
ncbi:hypothetical protein PybrP1_009829 [[Pythium] brassicae (nom. inval.)]|nr:hypothetical protein PybrP1_009829 [[Pythium] brassicae (nom. inval.)]